MKDLTQEQANVYFANDGANCPFCGDEDICATPYNDDDGNTYRRCGCLVCQRWWHDDYGIVAVSAEVPVVLNGITGAEPGEWRSRINRIIVEVRGGVVQDVYCSSKADVSIMDHDNQQNGDLKAAAAMGAKHAELRKEIGRELVAVL